MGIPQGSGGFEIGDFLLLDGLPSQVDEPRLPENDNVILLGTNFCNLGKHVTAVFLEVETESLNLQHYHHGSQFAASSGIGTTTAFPTT